MTRTAVAKSIILCGALALLVAACGPSDPAAKTARLRSMYSARLNGFIVQAEPAPEPEIFTEEGAEPMEPAAAEATEPVEGEEAAPVEAAPAEPATSDILLDILIQHDSPEILAGITVDISMVDRAQREKASWKVWFDTSKVAKANITQYSHVLEDVQYEEGDGFYAEVRHPVPEEERSEYREFSAGG